MQELYISIPAPPRGATAAHTAISACPAPIFQFPPLREGRPGAVAHRVNRRISIPAPPRGATARMFSREPTIVISIPAPPRGATWFAIAPPTTSDFNSRPSARGDRSVLDAFLFSVFQFPPLREGRRFGRPLRAATCTFQFPPLREGRPARRQEEPLDGQIFQFPPLREGRLNGHNISGVFPYISIPAPPRGATGFRFLRSQHTADFNSRPSARGEAKDMQFLQIFCSTLTNQHGLTIVPRNLSRLFW